MLSNFCYCLVVAARLQESVRPPHDGFDFRRSFVARFGGAAIERQTHGDRGAFARRALEADRSAVQADEAAHDG